VRDFGGMVVATPGLVVRPARVEEVVAGVREAGRLGLPVVTRGAGHSTYGQGLTQGGVLLDMRGLGGVRDLRADRIVVEAGATWRDVLDATLPIGARPPVLPDYLDLTVGGTLSAGGLGSNSHIAGPQTDHVLEMEVVTGTGELVRCSPAEHRELFDGVRAGLGRCGVIVSAALELVPAPARVFTAKVAHACAADLLDAQHGPAGAIDLVGQAKLGETGWRFELTRVTTAARGPGWQEMSFLQWADRMREDVAQLRDLGEWTRPHPWAVMFVPREHAVEVIEETLARTGRGELGMSGVVLINPVRVSRTPLLRMSENSVHFAMLRTASPGGISADELVRLNRALYERVREIGGFRYPIDAITASRADWGRHYGPMGPVLRQVQQRYDPGGRFCQWLLV